ncbi:MAG: nuclear transport factor 2 family protein [Thermodesulfobacteriota bacterium]
MGSTDQESVREVVQRYIDGTFNGDAGVIRKCFHPQAVMNGYLGDQLFLGGPEPFFQQIENSPSMSQAGAPYQAEITSLDLVGRVASATVKETGFAGEMNFTNYFHLIKDEGQWKIISKLFTTE